MSEPVNSTDFQAKVLEASGPVLVDFSATWCGPCQMLAPVIEQIAGELAGRLSVFTVDIDQNPVLASRYGVSAVPTLILFENGQVIRKTMGYQSKDKLLAFIG